MARRSISFGATTRRLRTYSRWRDALALADAWYKGARSWDDQRRRDFANGPRNLLAVAGQVNFDKAFVMPRPGCRRT